MSSEFDKIGKTWIKTTGYGSTKLSRVWTKMSSVWMVFRKWPMVIPPITEWTFIHWPMVSIHPAENLSEYSLTSGHRTLTERPIKKLDERPRFWMTVQCLKIFRLGRRQTGRRKGHVKAGVTGNNPSSPPVEFSDSFLLKPLSPKPKQASKQKWVFGDVSIFDTGVCEGKKRFLFTPASTAGQIYPQATMQHPCQKL